MSTEKVQERIDKLRAVGVEITNDKEWFGEPPNRYWEYVPGTFYHAVLPFSAEEWLSIAQSEGDNYLGGCCGQMSALQDQIEHVFRFGGDVDRRSLRNIAEMAKDHGVSQNEDIFGPLDDDKFDLYIESFNMLSPWDKIGLIYTAVEPVLPSGDLEPYKSREDKPEKPAHSVLSNLDFALRGVTWQDLFSFDEQDKMKDQHHARRKLNLAKIYPLVLELKEELEKIDLSFNGFAILDETGQLANNAYGPCVFTEREGADYIVEISKAELHVVPCSVDLEKGLTLHNE